MNDIIFTLDQETINSLRKGFTCEWIAPKIIYRTSDGMEWNNKDVANNHERALMRKRYYENEMKNTNWFMRLFNIKPSMKFYDSIR